MSSQLSEPGSASSTKGRARDLGSPEELRRIAQELYIYSYPLVLMEITRGVGTNVESPQGPHAPMNAFAHLRQFPDSSFTDVVRPNADTLYSSLFLDLTVEPMIIHVSDSGGRYYLLPTLDMWTDVFASPGARTTGTAEQTFAVAGPGWSGRLPDGVDEIRCPTGMAWMLGRTQANGVADYGNVHEFQNGLTVTPLSRFGAGDVRVVGTHDPDRDMTPPSDQVGAMDGGTFFAIAARLMKSNPPHPNDYSMLLRARFLGFRPGAPFDLLDASSSVREAVQAAPEAAAAEIKAAVGRTGVLINNWQMVSSPVGTYGTDYTRRAVIALMGLGANQIEDAIYPTAFIDSDGEPLDSSKRYQIHFGPEQIPPADAFWSLTMYDQRQLFTANPINRFAIGDRDSLAFNPDGSLDLYVSRDSPGAGLESNWLPAPASGPFSMNLRLYWPRREAIVGAWAPPPVRRQP